MKKNKINKRIISRSQDWSSTPEIIDVEGFSEKELIFNFLMQSEYAYLAIDEYCIKTDNWGNNASLFDDIKNEIIEDSFHVFLDRVNKDSIDTYYQEV